MVINEPWYEKLQEKYGFECCVEAGYFYEEKPWDNYSYNEQHFFLPKDSTVIQFSGAFYPIHEGHLSIIKQAIDAVVERTGVTNGCVVIHVDHLGYRATKGIYSEDQYFKAFGILEDLFQDNYSYRGFDFELVYEDDMPKGCSRNFTRLYSELMQRGNDVYFLCGGDRANFALTFINEGKCIIAGRDIEVKYTRYKHLENDRIWFLEGNNTASSTKIREGL